MSDKRTLYVGKFYVYSTVLPILTFYLGGLDESVTEDMVLQLFTTFGEVANVEIPLDQATCM